MAAQQRLRSFALRVSPQRLAGRRIPEKPGRSIQAQALYCHALPLGPHPSLAAALRTERTQRCAPGHPALPCIPHAEQTGGSEQETALPPSLHGTRETRVLERPAPYPRRACDELADRLGASWRYCVSFGGNRGEGSLAVQARLKTRTEWPKAASKWRLEPLAPFDTALWTYSGWSLRYGPLGLLRMVPSIRPFGPTQDGPFDTALWAYSGWPLRYGPLGLLRMTPSIRPLGPTGDAHSESPPTCIHYLHGPLPARGDHRVYCRTGARATPAERGKEKRG
jgi:hypothetical protein